MIIDLEQKYNQMLTECFGDVEKMCSNNNQYIFAKDKEGNTFLHYAASDGELKLVKYLLTLGACPYMHNVTGMTPIANAASNSNYDVLVFLLEQSPYGLIDRDMEELLAIAASNGSDNCLSYMIENGFDCNALYRDDPIIYWAIQSGQLSTVKLLCESGANLDSTNADGMTALYDASANGLIEIMRLLIECGANVDTPSKNGCTPLIIAASYDKPEAVRLLLDSGCNHGATTIEGKNALMSAVMLGNEDVVRILLEKGAKKDSVDKKGRSWQHYIKKVKNRRIRERIEKALLEF